MGDFIGWLTGHDKEKEQSVYKNEEKVKAVVDNLKTISDKETESAKEKIYSALNAIADGTGFSDYVYEIHPEGYDEVFESISSTILQAAEMINSKADAIKKYNDASDFDKVLSTFAMTGAKLGEGILSVGEDIGDGLVSIAGWIAPKDSGLEKACEDIIKKDWSHDAFNFYYNSDFAKKSAYTEDSAIAGGVKIIGNTAGYLALGGIISGASGVGVKSSSGVLKSLRTAATSTTKVNTFTAALTGMGSGTESALQSGLSMNEASVQGAGQGITQGLIAYVGGKFGERNTKKQFAKEFEGTGSDSTKFMSKSNAKAQIETSNSLTESGKQQIMEKIDGMSGNITRRKIANDVLKNQGLNSFQGYTDSITKWGQNTGASIAQEGLISTVTGGLHTTGTSAVNKLNSAKDTFSSAIQDPKKTFNNALDGVKGSAQDLKRKGDMLAIGLKYNPKGVLSNVAKTSIQTVGENIPTIAATTDSSLKEISYRKGINQFEKNQITNQLNVEIPTDKILKDPNLNATEIFKYNDTQKRDTSSNEQSGKQKSNQNNTQNNQPYSPSNYESSQTQFRQASSNVSPSNNQSTGTVSTTKSINPDSPKSPSSSNPTVTNETVTSSTKNSTTSGPTTSITTPPSNAGNGNEATTGSTNTIHTGGGYTGTNGYTSSPSGYTPGQSNTIGNMTDGTIDGTTGTDSSITGALTEGTTSIEDVIKGSKVTKIPTSPSPVTTTSSSSGSSAVIPIAAGLSAAAAAGIGAKAYMDRKHNNDNGEDDEDEFDTDEWSGYDSVDIQYDEDTANGENYLDDDDDYSYQATSNNEEKYDARSSEELADLQ